MRFEYAYVLGIPLVGEIQPALLDPTVEIGTSDLIGHVQQPKIGIGESDGSFFHRHTVVTADADRIWTDVREQSAIPGGCNRWWWRGCRLSGRSGCRLSG